MPIREADVRSLTSLWNNGSDSCAHGLSVWHPSHQPSLKFAHETFFGVSLHTLKATTLPHVLYSEVGGIYTCFPGAWYSVRRVTGIGDASKFTVIDF